MPDLNKAKEILQTMSRQGDGQASAVASYLVDAVGDYEGDDPAAFLVTCAEELEGWARHFVRELLGSAAPADPKQIKEI